MKRYQVFCFYPDEGWSIMYSTNDRSKANTAYDELREERGEEAVVLADVLRAANATQLQCAY